MTGWLCCERALLRGECLSGYNTGMIVLKEKTLLLNGQMPGWSVAWLCLLLGRVPAMPGPSCWGCVPTPAAPLSPFRAEEPEGPSALISLQGYLESHLQIGLVFPCDCGELPFPVGVRASTSLLQPAGCCCLANHSAMGFLEHSWPRTRPQCHPAVCVVPCAPELGVSPRCFCDIRTCCSSIDMVTYKVCLVSINSNDNLDKSEFLPFFFFFTQVSALRIDISVWLFSSSLGNV